MDKLPEGWAPVAEKFMDMEGPWIVLGTAAFIALLFWGRDYLTICLHHMRENTKITRASEIDHKRLDHEIATKRARNETRKAKRKGDK